LAINIPSTYLEARNTPKAPHRHKAIKEELGKKSKYNVWKVVKSTGQRCLERKWMFTQNMHGETGKPLVFKARYVAKGFRQISDEDYGEHFAGVAHKDSNRVFLSIVKHFGLL
jgi:hypothetical protein